MVLGRWVWPPWGKISSQALEFSDGHLQWSIDIHPRFQPPELVLESAAKGLLKGVRVSLGFWSQFQGVHPPLSPFPEVFHPYSSWGRGVFTDFPGFLEKQIQGF